MRIAVVTAIFGNYEVGVSDPVDQQFPADFYAFTDNPELRADRWQIVTTPYHYCLSNDAGTKNSIVDLIDRAKAEKKEQLSGPERVRFQKNMMCAKFYKINHYAIPLLDGYDVVVWLDGNFRILNADFTEICGRFAGNKITVYKHCLRSSVEEEVAVCINKDKYKDQELDRQYADYRRDGFPDSIGLMECGFMVFDHNDLHVKELLKEWWRHNLIYSYKDQVSFPFLCWKFNLYPKLLTEGTIYKNQIIDDGTGSCYRRHGH